MLSDIITTASDLFIKFFSTEQILSSVMAIVIIIMKFLTNNRATKLQQKTLLVSLPGEIEILAVGFVISSTINDSGKSMLIARISLVGVCFIIMMIQFAAERALENKLSGRWGIGTVFCVIILYAIAITLFIFVVYGGILNV